MKERVFNVFLFVGSRDNVICEVGVTVHECSGSDEDKTRLLQSKVHDDYRVCRRLLVNVPLTYETFVKLQQLGRHMDFLEFVMDAVNAPAQPLLCVTPIVDGVPRIEAVTDLTPAMNPLTRN